MNKEDYYLDSDKRSEGVKLPLVDREGDLSGDFIMVRWAWSDDVRNVMDNLKRDMRKKYASETDIDADDYILEGIIAQVAGWSFDDKCAEKDVREFLIERPDIAERIDTVSANTKLFFMDSGKSS